jgi:sigma-B regulation protein RsbU (phosphoserine phosphatase)
MFLLIAAPTLAIAIVVLWLGVRAVYRHSRQTVERTMTGLAANYASRFDGQLREAATIAETTARFMETVDRLDDEQVYVQLERNVRQMPLVYGAAMAFEPGTVKALDVLFSPYVHRAAGSTSGSGQELNRVNIDQSVYDWFRDPAYTWYTWPRAAGRGLWSDPYFDEGAGNVLMATYSAPFRRSGGGFGGVTTVDIDLPHLESTIAREFSGPLDFFVLTATGRFVYDPNTSRIMSKTIFDVARDLGRDDLAALALRMLKGEPGVASIHGWDADEPQWVFFAPIRSSGWIFACRVPEAVVMREVRTQTLWGSSAIAITILLILLSILMVSRWISGSIVRLKDQVRQIGRGNLDTRIDDAHGATELRELARDINAMSADLRSHIARLASEMSARDRIERDLDLARDIQRKLLPVTKPKVPGYEIAGWNQPADKTGGDYFDWQTRADGCTIISVADVTGHGIGPALVTAVCRAYARATFSTAEELATLIERLNELLVIDMPEGRFVTFVGALLDPARAHVDLVSAGHGPIFHYSAATGKLNEHHANDLPLGVAPGMTYGPAVPIDLQPGDLLMIVTDGFFEWHDHGGASYGLPRLREIIPELARLPIDQMIPAMYDRVRDFAAGAPQDDDLTAVVVRRVDGRSAREQ